MVTIRSELGALSFARVLQLSRHIHSSLNSSQRRERESRASCSGMLLLLMLFLLKHCTFYLSYSFPRSLLWDTLSRHSATICPKIVVPTDRWTHHTQVLYFYFVCWARAVLQLQSNFITYNNMYQQVVAYWTVFAFNFLGFANMLEQRSMVQFCN